MRPSLAAQSEAWRHGLAQGRGGEARRGPAYSTTEEVSSYLRGVASGLDERYSGKRVLVDVRVDLLDNDDE